MFFLSFPYLALTDRKHIDYLKGAHLDRIPFAMQDIRSCHSPINLPTVSEKIKNLYT